MLVILLAALFLYIAASCSKSEPSGKAQYVGDAVDLGLSVKWASHNVGALSPEAEGGLYGWSDITGSRRTQANIKLFFTNEGVTSVTWSSTFYGGITPPSNICASDSDLARHSWGGSWRLPTKAEMQELIDRCTWESITTVNSKPCVKVTGPNGNYILLPAAGYRPNETSKELSGSASCYWTGDRTPKSDQEEWKFVCAQYATAWCLRATASGPQLRPEVRSFGLSIRPVCD